MDNSDWIVKYFGYLVSEFNFRVVEKLYSERTMGNAMVLFLSAHIGIEVVLDRNEVSIAFNYPEEPRESWFNYKDALKCFSPAEKAYPNIGQLFDEKRAKHDSNADTWDDVRNAQLDMLASTLREKCAPILRGDLSMINEIEAIKEIRVAEIRKMWKR